MRRALAAVALVALLAGLAAWAVAAPWTTRPASALEPTASALGNGLGVESQRLAAAPATLANDPLDPSRSVLLVVGPGRAFSDADRAATLQFVKDGGFLVVADDAGQANSLLAPFGLAFERVRLVEGTSGWSWSNADLPLDLPSPTAVLAGPGAKVLGASSERSFLDRDASGAIDAADPAGPFPVAALVEVGDGAVLAVADADAFRGAALAGNGRWLKDVLAEAQPDTQLILVADPGAAEDPVLFGLAWLRTTGAGALRPALLAVAAVAVVGLAAGTSWSPWHAHRFRPLHFRRRAAMAEAKPPVAGLTERGAVALLAAPALLVLWALTGAAEAAIVAALSLVALGLAGLAQVPRVKGTRQLSTDATVEGTAVQVTVDIRANGAATLEMRDELPLEAEVGNGSAWGMATVGRHALRVSYALTPALRGKHKVGPLRARRHDALGLRTSETTVAEAQDLMVRPRAEPAGRTPMATRRPMATLGTHRVNRAGDGTEFHALRGYQPGDPFRSVNWKASARSKELMVNQRVHESMTCLTLLLDARQVAAAGPAARSPFARSCRAALSVAVGASRMRDRLRIVVYGDGVQEIPPQASARQIHEFTQMLAQLTPSGSTTLKEALQFVMPSLRPGLPVMVLSGLEDDPTAAEAMASLMPRGIRSIVVAPPPLTVPVDAEDGGAEAGAHRIEAQHAETLARLRASGVTVYNLDADLPIDSIFQRGVAA